MSKSIKLLIGILIAILAVLCVLGTVAFFFYQHKDLRAEVVLTSAYMGEEKTKFDDELNSVVFIVEESDSLDKRFEVILKTYQNLDDCMESLTLYFLSTNFVVKDSELEILFNSMKNSKSLLKSMMSQYKTKCENSSILNKNIAVNDIYVEMCNYLETYANIIQRVKFNLDEGVNQNVNIKFAMIDLYVEIAKASLPECTVKENKYTILKNSTNLSFMNTYFKLQNGEVTGLATGESFSKNCNKFIENYNLSNKAILCENFSTKVVNASLVNAKSAEDYTLYYFKTIYGV